MSTTATRSCSNSFRDSSESGVTAPNHGPVSDYSVQLQFLIELTGPTRGNAIYQALSVWPAVVIYND